MHLKKLRQNNYFLVSVFIAVFLIVRVLRLATDEINPDAVNWHYRSEQFIVALKSKNFINTYQHYHPGVTLMWLIGVPIELVRQISPSYRVYTSENFIVLHMVAKLALLVVHLVLTGILLGMLTSVFGFLPVPNQAEKHKSGLSPFQKALFVVTLLTFEPFFLGNARLLHMDVLLTYFVFLTLGFLYLYSEVRSVRYLVLTSLFLALACLTKSVGLMLVPFCLGYLVYKNSSGKAVLVFVACFLLITLVVFPALWVAPIQVVTNILLEGDRIGLRNGHSQIVFNEVSQNPGLKFYFLIFLLKTSPLLIFGLGSYLVMAIKKLIKLSAFDKLVLCFYVGYFLVMLYPAKKLDRYFVVEYPLMAYFAFLGLQASFLTFKVNRRLKVGLLGLVLLNGYSLFWIFPYYFTYTNPLLGSPVFANTLVAQKPFGLGVYDLEKIITSRYHAPKVGMLDTKPLKMIYPNSKVFDIREYGAGSYSVVVLGINETFSGELAGKEYMFYKDYTVKINGLDFWRIYVKKSQVR